MDVACEAAIQGDLSALQAALQDASSIEGYSINAKGNRCRTPLYQGCLGRQPLVVQWLLEQGATDDDGGAYICICATGRGGEGHPDPGERTAAVMRRFGFPVKKKKKAKTRKPSRSRSLKREKRDRRDEDDDEDPQDPNPRARPLRTQKTAQYRQRAEKAKEAEGQKN